MDESSQGKSGRVVASRGICHGGDRSESEGIKCSLRGIGARVRSDCCVIDSNQVLVDSRTSKRGDFQSDEFRRMPDTNSVCSGYT